MRKFPFFSYLFLFVNSFFFHFVFGIIPEKGGYEKGGLKRDGMVYSYPGDGIWFGNVGISGIAERWRGGDVAGMEGRKRRKDGGLLFVFFPFFFPFCVPS